MHALVSCVQSADLKRGRLEGVYGHACMYVCTYACPNYATNAGWTRGGVGEGGQV